MRRPAASLAIVTPLGLALLCSLIGVPAPARAAVVSWNNAAGGSWGTAANWSPAAVPGAGDDVNVDLPGTYTITASGAITVQTLSLGAVSGVQTITGTATVTSSGPMQVAAGSSGVLLRTLTLGGAGGFTVPASSAVTLQSCAVGTTFVNDGTVTLTGTGTVSGAFTSGVGSTLRLQGNSAVGGASHTFSTGFTNNGTIELTATGTSWAAALTVSSGTLTNAATRLIDVQAGTGGARTLTARLDNQGMLNVAAPLTVNKSAVAHLNSGTVQLAGGDLTLALGGGGASFTNSGAIDVPAGRTLTVTAGTFTHNAGTLGPGVLSLGSSCTANLVAAFSLGAISITNSTLNLTPALSTATTPLTCSSATLNGPGTITNAAGVTWSAASSTIAAPLVNDGTLVLTGTGSVTGNYTSRPGSVLRVAGIDAIGAASQTFANGFTNNGSVELTSSGSAWASALSITSGTLTNPAARTIDLLAGSGGARTLGLRLDNQGTVNVNAPLTLAKAAVAHTNGGSLNVTGADATLTLTGAASFTNTGSVTLSPGRTLTATGGTFNHNGGSLGPVGTLAIAGGCVASLTAAYSVTALNLTGSTLNTTPAFATSGTVLTATNSTLNGPGAITNSAGVTLPLSACTVNAPLSNEGVLLFTGSGAVNGVFATSGGSMLRVQGNNTIGGASVTFANGFTNNGTIELTSAASAWSSALNVTGGVLNNPAGHTIDVQLATGGTRTLGARLDNQGTLLVGTALTLSRSSVAHVNSGTVAITGGDLTLTLSGTGCSFTNTGTISIAAGRTLVVNAGVFSHNAGSLGSTGGLTFGSGVVANLSAPFAVGSLASSGSTVNLGPDLSTAGTVLTASGSSFNGPGILTNAAGVTTTLSSCTMNGPIVNDGTLVLCGTGSVPGAYTSGIGSTLRVQGNNSVGGASQTFANGFTNNGVIELTSINAAWASALNVTAGTLTNPAGRTIASQAGAGGARTLGARLDNQGVLDVLAPLGINRSGAVHSNPGTIHVTGGDLVLTLSGVGGAFTNTGTIALPAGRTLTVSGGVFHHDAGTLGAGGSLSLQGGTIAHLVAPFSVSAMAVTASTLNLTPALATNATALTATGSTLSGPGTITNSGGVTLTLQSCTLNAPLINDGTLVLMGPGSVNGTYSSGTGSTLRLLGSDAAGSANQTFANGFTNNGTLELTSTVAVAVSSLAVTDGVLVNAPSRMLDVLPGSGGARTITAQLDNQGTLRVAGPLTVNKPAVVHANSGTLQLTTADMTLTQSGATANFVNTGTVDIGASKTLVVSGGTLTNTAAGTLQGGGTLNVSSGALVTGGSIRPGSSPGQLRVLGVLPMSATSQTFIELGGTVAGSGFDRLTSSGALSLDGSLAISLVNGFAPAAGQSFPILGGATRTGRFTSITGIPLAGGLSLEPQYTDTSVALRVVAQTWVRRIPGGTAPLAREGHSAAFDAASHRMIVFGGSAASGALNDVHVLTNADGGGDPVWIALAPTGTAPAARWHHGAAYDPSSNTLVVFGGDDGAGSPTVFGDVWLLSHANGLGGAPEWTTLSPAGGPGARTGAAVAYDAAGRRLLVFGGSATAACGDAASDVWVLSNADGGGSPAWTALAPGGAAPSARAWARAGFDAALNRLVLFSGVAPCGTENAEMYALTHANGTGGAPVWLALVPGGTPPVGASLQAAAYDPVTDRLTVFGGRSGASYVGELSTAFSAGGFAGAPAWSDLTAASVAPAARADASAVQGADRVVLFGGRTAAGLSDEVFSLETDAGRVLGVPPGTSPAVRPGATAFARPVTPNPSSGAVGFTIDVAREQSVELSVCDLAGRRVATLQRGALAAGEHTFTWSGRIEGGGLAPAGVYFVRLRAEDATESRRVLRIR